MDTNVAIDYLNNKLPENASTLIESGEFVLSVISRMELLAWPSATSEQLQVLHSFIKASHIHSLDEPVIITGIDIRKVHSSKLPDAIIAATALVHDYTLLSRNISDFKKVPGLAVIDPYTL